ncbi:MAG TPA: hypothetical protein VK211_23575 [Kamptonema sp.]|nr:hypothetical protein [Kamptonema sp.]
MNNSSIYSRAPALGNNFLEELAFINLQEFLEKVNYICDLETNGQLSPQAAYEQIWELWKNHYEQSQLVFEKILFGTTASAV